MSRDYMGKAEWEDEAREALREERPSEALSDAVEEVRYCWEVLQGQCAEGDGFTERAATDLELAIRFLEKAVAAGDSTP